MARMLGLATGVPDYCYSQEEILEHYLGLQPESRRHRAMQAIYRKTGVECRHVAVERSYFDAPRSTQERNDVYMQVAVPLGERTIRALLDQTGYSAQDIDDLIVVSCTGFHIPGLDLYMAGQLKMRPDLHRTCVLGMGCYGAFPGLLRAYEAAQKGRRALVLCLELCSLHLQLDATAESVVSSALFADGAAAVLLGPDDTPPALSLDGAHPLPELLHFRTHCEYNTFEHMSFTLTDEGFRMYLSSYVPDLLASNITPFVDGMLADQGLSRDDVTLWGVHPGSQKIVEFVQQRLEIDPAAVESSYDVLRRYGNMSSATILFVLDDLRQQMQPEPGDYGVLMAFGPGLTMEGLVLRW